MIGLELPLERLRSMRRLVFGIGLAQLLLAAAAIGGVLLAAGSSVTTAVVPGLVGTRSSTALVLQLLRERREISTPAGPASFAVLLLQDGMAVPILFVLAALGTVGGSDAAGNVGLARARSDGGDPCRRPPAVAAALPLGGGDRQPPSPPPSLLRSAWQPRRMRWDSPPPSACCWRACCWRRPSAGTRSRLTPSPSRTCYGCRWCVPSGCAGGVPDELAWKIVDERRQRERAKAPGVRVHDIVDPLGNGPGDNPRGKARDSAGGKDAG